MIKHAILTGSVLLFFIAMLSYAQTPHSTPNIQSMFTNAHQLAKLTGTSGIMSMACGVAISGDTIVTTGGQGVYVFVKPATGWADMTPTAMLTPSDLSGWGCSPGSGEPSVAIRGDTVVLGAPRTQIGSNQGQGAAYVFVKPAGGWIDMTETAKLTASDGIVGSSLGWSVAINPAGTVIVAGAPAMSFLGGTGPGAAYFFLKPSTGWSSATESGKMTATDGVAGDEFGMSAAIGNRGVAIGSPFTKTACSPGAWYMFAKPANELSEKMTQTAKLTTCDAGVGSGFNAEAVAISGNTVVGGGLCVAFVFVEPVNGWSDMNPTATLLDPSSPSWMGASVAISGDRVVSGAFAANQDQGLADGFTKPAGGWAGTISQSVQFLASDGQPNDYFGTSIGISGSTVVVGAPVENNWTGAAYVFGPKPQ